MNTKLPEGYTARPVTMEDLEACVDLFNLYARATVGANQVEVASIREEWTSPVMNLETDTLAVFNQDGAPVAYAEFWDNNTLHVRYYTWVVVHPDYQGRGIGTMLMEWLVDHARRSMEKAPADARVEMHQSILSTNTDAAELFTRHGLEHVRSFYRMLVNFPEPPQPPAPVDGIVIRSITNDAEQRNAIYAVYDSFRDHWGMIDEPFEDYYKRWMDHLKNDHKYDPSLWFIALDGDQIAGISLCVDHIDEDADLGWVNTLGVRRPWRKRGLGEALLRYSFCALHERGKPRVGLGVDASSLTGATRLYEKAGMRASRQYNAYALVMRDGKDYSVRTLAE